MAETAAWKRAGQDSNMD